MKSTRAMRVNRARTENTPIAAFAPPVSRGKWAVVGAGELLDMTELEAKGIEVSEVSVGRKVEIDARSEGCTVWAGEIEDSRLAVRPGEPTVTVMNDEEAQ
jgi:hypothetical protein